MERIGIYGGTFNPPHIGHIRAAEYALEQLGLDKLILIPTCLPPHKELAQTTAEPEQRLQMLRLCAKAPGIEVCDMELSRGGVSYSVDTVLQLRKQYPDGQLILLMGSDMFAIFQQWKDYTTILRNAALGVFCRGDKGEREILARQKELLEEEGATVFLIENPVGNISSRSCLGNSGSRTGQKPP